MLSTSYLLTLSPPPTPTPTPIPTPNLLFFKLPHHQHIPSILPSSHLTTTPFHGGSFPRDAVILMDSNPPLKLAIAFLGPFLSGFGFLFILRIVMSWYPKLPLTKFPYVLAYTPTEPLLVQTRKIIPPLGGVDVTPVIWFGLISFLNEILLGPQGLLLLLSQQV